MEFASPYIEKAVDQLASLPGIGRKTALRLVLNLLNRKPEDVEEFGNAFIAMKQNIKFCRECHNISDQDQCRICLDPNRDESLICVVESVKDVMAVENTLQFRGRYHILGGIISPMNGIGPSDLTVDSLEKRITSGSVKEVVLALSTTMEGDTTNFYLYKKLKPYSVLVSAIARGVAVGDDLEYTDEITLGRSIINRTPYDSVFAK